MITVTFGCDDDFGVVTKNYSPDKQFWEAFDEATTFLCDGDSNLLNNCPDFCYIHKDNAEEIPLTYSDQNLTIGVLSQVLNLTKIFIHVTWNRNDLEFLDKLLEDQNMEDEDDNSNVTNYTRYWEEKDILLQEERKGELLHQQLKEVISKNNAKKEHYVYLCSLVETMSIEQANYICLHAKNIVDCNTFFSNSLRNEN